ncbi:hypothetical protein J6590_103480, partial [Homalodisca vitripennis]
TGKKFLKARKFSEAEILGKLQLFTAWKLPENARYQELPQADSQKLGIPIT